MEAVRLVAQAEYSSRRTVFDQQATSEQQRFLQIGNARLLVAVLTAALAYLVFGQHVVAPLWLGVPVAAFAALVIWHELTVRRQLRAERARRIYELGLARLEDRWMGQGDAGERFREEGHPYADDLDVFGRGSLFELVSTARTPVGQQTLAAWLKAPAPPADVRMRQQAIDELRQRIDLREDLALLGEDIREEVHPEALLRWANSSASPLPRATSVLAACFVAVTLAVGLFSDDLGWPPTAVLAPLLAQICFAFWLRPRVLQIIAGIDLPGRDLALLAQVLTRLERESFHSERLRALQESLKTHGHQPSREIAHLRRLIELLDSRRNAFFAPVAALLLWGTQSAVLLERWRRAHGAVLSHWLQAVGEMEALLAFSGYAYEHPHDPFPDLLPGEEAQFVASGVGHPLLPADRCVRNDVALGTAARLLIVSGSNMSGKSTLLRAVGLNAVLAFAGAPVRAASLRLSPLVVGTSLRPQDSLQSGTSRFYAEITRLRDIVDRSRGPVPLLFLLDELLSGTNSYDRQRGSAGVLHGLLQTPAIGLLTTHDLALAGLSETLPNVLNVHFEDRLVDGKLEFDYQLRPGVVQRSNALELMRSIGLEV